MVTQRIRRAEAARRGDPLDRERGGFQQLLRPADPFGQQPVGRRKPGRLAEAALETAQPGQMAGETVPDEHVEGPPLVLPPYPFVRDRHWIGAAVTVPAAQPVVASDDVLALVSATLAAELGVAATEIRADADFRAQGADSMAALRLIHSLREATGVEVGHVDLERLGTPAALAGWVAERRGVAVRAQEAAAILPPEQWQSPLSEGQRALWVWQSLYPDSAAYNVPMAFHMSGIDRDALERACGWLLSRFGYPVAAVVVGLLLGRLIETELLRAYQMAGGDWREVLNHPAALVIFVLMALSLGFSMWKDRRRRLGDAVSA